MLSQPRLIKNEQSTAKPINLKSQPSGSARFILGLNNRVSQMDKRLKRLEATSDHVLRHHIGYRELGLTLALALLMFTSISLVLRDQGWLMNYSTTTTTNKADALNLLLQSDPNLKQAVESALAQQNKIESSTENQHLTWPLERQPNITNVQYSQHKHGIELNAKLGDPIVAIDDGDVLYSGNAINSYGNLILIQHSNNIISVYGNNYSNYVQEGNHVSKGQLIAAVGESDGKQARLYFEIRYKGKAQDPFLYFQ